MTDDAIRQDLQPSMLILSRSVYAKRLPGNTFYPGCVDKKLSDGHYLVQFTDGCYEEVSEDDITWLGYWGLPPDHWPRHPVVQIGGRLQDLNTLPTQKFVVRNDISDRTSRFEKDPEKNDFYVDYSSGDFVREEIHDMTFSRAVERMQNAETSNVQITDDKQMSEHNTPHIVSPACERRVSVLRMRCIGSRKHQGTDGVNFNKDSSGMVSFPNGLHNVMRQKKSKLSSSDDVDLQKKHEIPLPFQNRQRSFSSQASLTCQPLHYGKLRNISTYDGTQDVIPASLSRIETQYRRRSENKKCRKVYGIENRNIWCTQCKWKKACTRFTASEKISRSMFVV